MLQCGRDSSPYDKSALRTELSLQLSTRCDLGITTLTERWQNLSRHPPLIRINGRVGADWVGVVFDSDTHAGTGKHRHRDRNSVQAKYKRRVGEERENAPALT
jgi:hypothetical protein